MTHSFCHNLLHAGSVPGWVSAVPNSGLDKFAWLFFCFLLQTVKVADFGVARVKAQSGVMTAETGTYRWMAPEVIFCYWPCYLHHFTIANVYIKEMWSMNTHTLGHLHGLCLRCEQIIVFPCTCEKWEFLITNWFYKRVSRDSSKFSSILPENRNDI